MSSIKLSPASTGSAIFTIEAPATSTNRTLTLPDATGTVQVSGNPISGTTGSFSGDLSFNSGYGSAAVAYGCRAWVNFNGTGTVAIRASGNVSSVGDLGVGYYQVNFTNAMPDANYSGVITNNNYLGGCTTDGFTQTASAMPVLIRQTNSPTTSLDSSIVTVAVFR